MAVAQPSSFASSVCPPHPVSSVITWMSTLLAADCNIIAEVRASTDDRMSGDGARPRCGWAAGWSVAGRNQASVHGRRRKCLPPRRRSRPAERMSSCHEQELMESLTPAPGDGVDGQSAASSGGGRWTLLIQSAVTVAVRQSDCDAVQCARPGRDRHVSSRV